MRLTLALLASLATPAFADNDEATAGMGAPAGLFAATNKQDLPEIMLSAGQPLGEAWHLKSGTYYEVEITSDGSIPAPPLTLTGKLTWALLQHGTPVIIE